MADIQYVSELVPVTARGRKWLIDTLGAHLTPQETALIEPDYLSEAIGWAEDAGLVVQKKP